MNDDEPTPPPPPELVHGPRSDLGEQPREQVADGHVNQASRQPAVRPSLTLSEAARACLMSQSAIKRMHYRPEGSAFPNAWQEPGSNGSWRIPIEDLIQAGLRPNRREQSADPGREQGSAPPSFDAKLSELKADRERFRAEAERWRAVAEERERSLQRMDRAFNLLGTGNGPERRELAAKRKRWWHRKAR